MNYHMPVKVLFGNGSINSLKDIMGNYLNADNPLIVTDRGILESGVIDAVKSQVGEIDIFSDVEPNPRAETVNRAGELARKNKNDLIIATGGGSSLDAGKAIALLAVNNGIIEDYEGREKYKIPPVPLVAIPTTCGTGSEVTWVSVITDMKRKFKMSIKGSRMFPAAALVDPDLLLSLPKPLIASTGLDALTHAVEAYTVKPATPFTDVNALNAIELIADSVERAFKDIKGDSEARNSIMLGSTMAGIAFGNSDVGSVHCLAESLGAVYDVPHGVANSIFLPYVMDFNLPVCKDRFADIAVRFGINGSDSEIAAKQLIKKIREISRRLEIPEFKELGISDEQFPLIAKYSYQNNSTPSNIRDITEKDYLDILIAAYKGMD